MFIITFFLEGEGNGGARGGGEEEYGEEGWRGGVDLATIDMAPMPMERLSLIVKADTVRNEIADYVDDLFLKVGF